MPTVIVLCSPFHTLLLSHFLLPHCPLLCCEEGSVRPEWKLFRVGQSPVSEGCVHVVGCGVKACRHIADLLEVRKQNRTDGQAALINSLSMRTFHYIIIKGWYIEVYCNIENKTYCFYWPLCSLRIRQQYKLTASCISRCFYDWVKDWDVHMTDFKTGIQRSGKMIINNCM